MRRPSSRQPRSQRPRARPRRGRCAPLNGSVTREDLRAIHAEFSRGVEELYTADQRDAIGEHLVYLLGAIVDRPIGPGTRAKMRRRALDREAAKRRQRAAAAEVTQLPARAAAAA